jgi:hypothetical protein
MLMEINSVIKRMLSITGTNFGDVLTCINSVLEQSWKIFIFIDFFEFALSAIFEYSALYKLLDFILPIHFVNWIVSIF